MDTESQLPSPRAELVKEKSVTMEYFLETTKLDQATADLLVKYDKDGNGSFSKDEVVSIILELREAIKSNEDLGASNKLFKRLLTAAFVFCVLLLASMFGLSYAVAALTANTEVQSDGTLVSKGTTTVIATDSRADLYGINKSEAGYCLSAAQVFTIRDSILVGRQVLVENNDGEYHVVEQLTASGAVIDDEAGKYCFHTPESTTPLCLTRSDDCTQERRRHRARILQDSPRRSLHDTSTCNVLTILTNTACYCHTSNAPLTDPDFAHWQEDCCDAYFLDGDGYTYSALECSDYEENFDDR
jgi:hypothetical protein